MKHKPPFRVREYYDPSRGGRHGFVGNPFIVPGWVHRSGVTEWSSASTFVAVADAKGVLSLPSNLSHKDRVFLVVDDDDVAVFYRYWDASVKDWVGWSLAGGQSALAFGRLCGWAGLPSLPGVAAAVAPQMGLAASGYVASGNLRQWTVRAFWGVGTGACHCLDGCHAVFHGRALTPLSQGAALWYPDVAAAEASLNSRWTCYGTRTGIFLIVDNDDKVWVEIDAAKGLQVTYAVPARGNSTHLLPLTAEDWAVKKGWVSAPAAASSSAGPQRWTLRAFWQDRTSRKFMHATSAGAGQPCSVALPLLNNSATWYPDIATAETEARKWMLWGQAMFLIVDENDEVWQSVNSVAMLYEVFNVPRPTSTKWGEDNGWFASRGATTSNPSASTFTARIYTGNGDHAAWGFSAAMHGPWPTLDQLQRDARWYGKFMDLRAEIEKVGSSTSVFLFVNEKDEVVSVMRYASGWQQSGVMTGVLAVDYARSLGWMNLPPLALATSAGTATGQFTARVYNTMSLHGAWGFTKGAAWPSLDELKRSAKWMTTAKVMVDEIDRQGSLDSVFLVVDDADVVHFVCTKSSPSTGGARFSMASVMSGVAALDYARSHGWANLPPPEVKVKAEGSEDGGVAVERKPSLPVGRPLSEARFPWRGVVPSGRGEVVFLGVFEECDVWYLCKWDESGAVERQGLRVVYGRGRNDGRGGDMDVWRSKGVEFKGMAWRKALPFERAAILAIERHRL